LSFVKFWILNSSDANQAIYHPGRQALFLDIDKIARHHKNIRRQRTGDLSFLSFPRWAPEPWGFALVFIGQMEVHSDRIAERAREGAIDKTRASHGDAYSLYGAVGIHLALFSGALGDCPDQACGCSLL
jgi:hypothetical protein